MADYPPGTTLAIFDNTKKEKDSQPDVNAVGEMKRGHFDMIAKWFANNPSADEIPIEGGGWTKKSKAGNKYVFMNVQIQYKIRDQVEDGVPQQPPADADPFTV